MNKILFGILISMVFFGAFIIQSTSSDETHSRSAVFVDNELLNFCNNGTVPVNFNINKNNILLFEGFEGSFPPDGWMIIDHSGTGTWELQSYGGGTYYEPPGSGSYFAVADSDTHSTLVFNTSLYTSALNLTGYSLINFEVDHAFEDYAGIGQAWIATYSGGTDPSNLEEVLIYMDLDGDDGQSGGGAHFNTTFDPSTYTNPSNVYFEFWYSTDGGTFAFSYAIDNVNVTSELTNIPPIANFTWTPSSPTINNIIQFTDLSTDRSIVNWTWDFDDGNISYEQNPTHQYAVNDTYNVTLTVKDDDNATNSTWKIITVTLPVYNENDDTWFSGIQEALNAASSGDTIIVYSGIFYENILINKSVILKAGSTPIINGMDGIGIHLQANNTIIQDMTLINCSRGIYIYNESFKIHDVSINNCTVFNCTIASMTGFIELNNVENCVINSSRIYESTLGKGILMYNSDYVDITNNEIYNFSVSALDTRWSDHINILNNNIYNNFQCLYSISSHYTNLSDNNIYDNYYGQGYTDGVVSFQWSDNAIINNNNIFNNRIKTLYFTSGCQNMHIHYNRFYDNDFAVYNNQDYGINSINASHNWWGHKTGSNHSSNPYGTGQGGDSISDNVTFMPWYATNTTTKNTENVIIIHNPVMAISDTINSGIDIAFASDTVYVKNGTYYENVIINKMINLTGENNTGTIVDGNGVGDVFYISANLVNISNVTLQNSGNGGNDEGVDIRNSFCKLSSCIITNNRIGVSSIVDYITLENCTIKYSSGDGIVLSSNNNIYFCTISYNGNSGIFCITSNTIHRCFIDHNSGDGISNAGAGNIITENSLYYNGNNNVYGGWNHQILNNTIIGANQNGIAMIGTSVIKGNLITLNYGDGILVGPWAACNGNTIENNTINSNWGDGIDIHYDSGVSQDNIIKTNNIETNDEYGINLGINTVNNTVYNNFLNNTDNAIDFGDNQWNLSTPISSVNIIGNPYLGGNYWSDYIGHDTDGDGLGDINIPHGPGDYLPLTDPNYAPIANFTFLPLSPSTKDMIYFTDTSTDIDNNIVNWTWIFDDGNLSYLQNPIHQYATNGTYNICLTVRDDNGANDMYCSLVIVYLAPVANYSYSPTNPTDLDMVTFTDLSYDLDGFIVNWSWDFDDGSTSYLQNPTHQFSDGSYNVCLTVRDNDGATDTYCETIIIIPSNIPPTADFIHNPVLPETTDIVQFTDTSNDVDGTIDSWYWDFGDGNTSTQQNPAHQYTTGGRYHVTIQVIDDDGATDNTAKLVLVDIDIISFTSLSHGWNLISLSFNQSLFKDDMIIKSDGYFYSLYQGIVNNFIFGWDRPGQYYTFANTLYPGYGYWMFAYDNCEIWLENFTLPPEDTYITELSRGWNIMGIPLNQSISKTDILVNDTSWSDAVTAGLVSDFVFGWDRAGQYYNFAITLESCYAYWIYAYQPCTLKRN